MKAAPRGPTLLKDFILREKITHFDHERIPERIVHARGSSSHGFFELTQSLSQYTKAEFLQRIGDKPPVLFAFRPSRGVRIRATWHATCAVLPRNSIQNRAISTSQRSATSRNFPAAPNAKTASGRHGVQNPSDRRAP
jgi:hypothetical protein